jgi:hypothetical protein
VHDWHASIPGALLAAALYSSPITLSVSPFVASVAQAAEGDSGHKQSGKKQGGGSSEHGSKQGGGKGQKDVMMKGQGEPGEDSDRPVWAGVKGGKAGGGGQPSGAGTKKGDLYGDLYVILRDEDGVPVLKQLPDGTWVVQPIDANGNIIPLSDEGEALDPTLLQSVEFERLNVAKSPSKVLTHSLDEAFSKISAGSVITLDAAGRIVIDGSTIDSPLENLALYKALMTNTLPTEISSKLPSTLSASSLLAAASDKTSTLTVDTMVYLNAVLGINLTTNNGVTYSSYDFTSDYDRQTVYGDKTAEVLVLQADGVTYLKTTVNIYDAVFNSTDWNDADASGGADDFAQAADDALQVIEYVHDNAVR